MTTTVISPTFFFLIEKEIILKKTCYNLEGGRLPKPKRLRLDNEKYVCKKKENYIV